MSKALKEMRLPFEYLGEQWSLQREQTVQSPEARRCCEERVVGSEFGEVRGAEGGEIQQEDKVGP